MSNSNATNSNANSNANSEYEVINNEIRMIEEAEDPELIVRRELQTMDMNVVMVLNRYNIEDEVMACMARSKVKYQQLKMLTVEDLEGFGIRDNRLREEMIQDFQLLESQDDFLRDVEERLLERINKENISVTDILKNHLYKIDTVLAATCLHLGVQISNGSELVVVDKRFCSSKLIMQMLQKLAIHASEMKEIMETMSNPNKYEKTEKKFKEKMFNEKVMFYVKVASCVGLFISGYFVAKHVNVKIV